jgi:uncharacterized protein YndB with AHSA1/START domain
MVLTYGNSDHPNRGKTLENTDVVKGRFLKFVPDEQVVHSVTFESDDPAYAGEMKMSWDLAPVQSGTNVTITCENVPAGIRQEDHCAGLQASLRNLAALVER